MVLQAVATGDGYGFSVMEITGLPSGTVYPALRRLESDELISSQWEKAAIAEEELRPPRKYYRLTKPGKSALEACIQRYPLLARMAAPAEARKP